MTTAMQASPADRVRHWLHLLLMSLTQAEAFGLSRREATRRVLVVMRTMAITAEFARMESTEVANREEEPRSLHQQQGTNTAAVAASRERPQCQSTRGVQRVAR